MQLFLTASYVLEAFVINIASYFHADIVHEIFRSSHQDLRKTVMHLSIMITSYHVHYNQFSVGSANEEYPLTVGGLTGVGTNFLVQWMVRSSAHQIMIMIRGVKTVQLTQEVDGGITSALSISTINDLMHHMVKEHYSSVRWRFVQRIALNSNWLTVHSDR